MDSQPSPATCPPTSSSGFGPPCPTAGLLEAPRAPGHGLSSAGQARCSSPQHCPRAPWWRCPGCSLIPSWVRELGPAWAAPWLRDQAGKRPGGHCTGRLVPPAGPAAAHQWARRNLALLVLLSASSQDEEGHHLLPAQPCPAQLSIAARTLSHSPHSLQSWGQSPWPHWVAQAGSEPNSREAEPSGSSPAQSGHRGQPTNSPPPTALSPPRGRTARSAEGRSAMPPATSEEKHPLYYRPQKHLWQLQEDQVYTGCFHFSARGRGEQTQPALLTALWC